MKKTNRKDINWKQILIIVISFALLAALCVTCVSIFTKKDKDSDGYVEVIPKFSIGGLKNDGTYEDTDASLYTKDAISAQNVKIVLEFDSTVTYQLFFYDEFDNFISAGVALGKGSETEVPDGATAFRIELTPVWDEDVEEDDQKVTLLNKGSFTKQLTVKVIELEEAEDADNTTDPVEDPETTT